MNKIVELPRAEDFCRGDFVSADGKRHCLLGWMVRLIPVHLHKKARANLHDSITKRTTRRPIRIATFNDNRRNSRETLAEVFEEAFLETMDYEIVEE